jgi:type III restriction enzyme
MNRIAEEINQRLSLRKPLKEALNILVSLNSEFFPEDKTFAEIKNRSNQDLEILKDTIKTKYSQTFTDFERAFPSICFSIATGVGKTRLMGACIAYLYLEKRIKNFFVLAPNLTIYNKLIDDFGNSSSEKYVFKGIAEFVHNKPLIITGDNYNQVVSLFKDTEIRINIFNVSKFAREIKPLKEGDKNLMPRIKRLSEYLGQSYWEYLSGLNDLVIFMDEAHRYHATISKESINELKPILGVELTATPVDEKNRSFNNVVYEYSLARALADGLYVKNPTIATRKNFNPVGKSEEEIEKIKLEDAVSIHEDTKQELKLYSINTGNKLVKPFILVVCKDTVHAKAIYNLLISDSFYDGAYVEKVLQIDSTTRNQELIEQQFISLEQEENEIEIVIHVNMLKEGWDVTNLYTIVPLRAANASVLVEQT